MRIEAAYSRHAFQALHDEWLEEIEGHFLWKTALVELKLRSYDDNRTARVVNPFSEEVLPKSTLFSLEHLRESF